MNIREIKEKYSVNNRQLSVVTGIPMRSLQQWEKGERKPPEYIYGLIESALERNVVVRCGAPVLVGHTPTVSASRVNSILMKDFCALTREDVGNSTGRTMPRCSRRRRGRTPAESTSARR